MIKMQEDPVREGLVSEELGYWKGYKDSDSGTGYIDFLLLSKRLPKI